VADSCRRILEIEIPQEIVKKRADEIVGEFRRHARLPGFRPGKAPLSLVQQRYRDDIRSEILRDLVPQYVATQAKEQNWELVGNPSISDIEYAEESPLKFKATLEIMPEIELKDFRDLEVEVSDTTVHDEDVEIMLHDLQEEGATYVNVDEPRPLQDGDSASIAVHEATAGPEAAAIKEQDLLCEIGGAKTVKEFTENLRGVSLGEEKTFPVAYPADWGDHRTAGRTVTYHVKVLGIKKKQLPELNDEFARELGPFESLEDVRKRIREDLEKARQRDADQGAKSEVREKLAQLHEFPVPDMLVERQVEKRMEAFKRQIAAKNLNPQSLELDWARLRAAQQQGAVADVKSTLILEKIAHENNLAVAAEEVAAEVQKISAATHQSPEVVEAYLTKDGGLDRIKSRLRIEKALEFVFQNVRKKAKSVVAPGDPSENSSPLIAG
jgi:trigger factor